MTKKKSGNKDQPGGNVNSANKKNNGNTNFKTQNGGNKTANVNSGNGMSKHHKKALNNKVHAVPPLIAAGPSSSMNQNQNPNAPSTPLLSLPQLMAINTQQFPIPISSTGSSIQQQMLQPPRTGGAFPGVQVQILQRKKIASEFNNRSMGQQNQQYHKENQPGPSKGQKNETPQKWQKPGKGSGKNSRCGSVKGSNTDISKVDDDKKQKATSGEIRPPGLKTNSTYTPVQGRNNGIEASAPKNTESFSMQTPHVADKRAAAYQKQRNTYYNNSEKAGSVLSTEEFKKAVRHTLDNFPIDRNEAILIDKRYNLLISATSKRIGGIYIRVKFQNRDDVTSTAALLSASSSDEQIRDACHECLQNFDIVSGKRNERMPFSEVSDALLNQNCIYRLDTPSEAFPEACYYCRLCDFHINSISHAMSHLDQSSHFDEVEREKQRSTLIAKIPEPTEEQLKAINSLLEDVGNVETNKWPDDFVEQLLSHLRTDVFDDIDLALVSTSATQGSNADLQFLTFGSTTYDAQLADSDVNLSFNVEDADTTKVLNLLRTIIEKLRKYQKDHDVKEDADLVSENGAPSSIKFTFQGVTIRLSWEGNGACQTQICTSRLLRTYVSLRNEVAVFIRLVRLWAFKAGLDSKNRQKIGLPRYGFDLMVIHFLQQAGMLPVLHELTPAREEHSKNEMSVSECDTTDPHSTIVPEEARNRRIRIMSSYLDDIEKINETFDLKKEWNMAKLWIEYFKYYTEKHRDVVVQITQKEAMSKDHTRWNRKGLHVVDPFRGDNVFAIPKISSWLSFYFNCLLNTYLYFAVPRTTQGPVVKVELYQNKVLSPTKKKKKGANVKEESQSVDTTSEKAPEQSKDLTMPAEVASEVESLVSSPVKAVQQEHYEHASSEESEEEEALEERLLKMVLFDNIPLSQLGPEDVEIDNHLDGVYSRRTLRRLKRVASRLPLITNLPKLIRDKHGDSKSRNHRELWNKGERKPWHAVERSAPSSPFKKMTMDEFGHTTPNKLQNGYIEEKVEANHLKQNDDVDCITARVNCVFISEPYTVEAEAGIELETVGRKKTTVAEQLMSGGMVNIITDVAVQEEEAVDEKVDVGAIICSEDCPEVPEEDTTTIVMMSMESEDSVDAPKEDWSNENLLVEQSQEDGVMDEKSGTGTEEEAKSVETDEKTEDAIKKSPSPVQFLFGEFPRRTSPGFDDDPTKQGPRKDICFDEFFINENVDSDKLKKRMQQLKAENMRFSFVTDSFSGGYEMEIKCSSCDGNHSVDSCPSDKEPALLEYKRKRTPDELEEFGKMITDYYERNRVSNQRLKSLEKTVKDIENILSEKFEQDIKLSMFGSIMTGMGLKGSDVDLCFQFGDSEEVPEKKEAAKVIKKIAKFMWSSRRMFRNIQPISSAKVPIVKFTFPCGGEIIESDISYYNTLALYNTKLLKEYTRWSPNNSFAKLGLFIKHWAKCCDIGDASKGSISSYAYILLLISYLQNTTPPVLPHLQEVYRKDGDAEKRIIENWDTYFFESTGDIAKNWSKNKQSLGELLIGFFDYYATFDFRHSVVQCRRETSLSKLEKEWNKPLCIEDPFDLHHNLGSGVSKKMFMFIKKSIICSRNVFMMSNCREKVLREAETGPSFVEKYKDEILAECIQGSAPKDRQCHACNRVGHFADSCPQRSKRRDDNDYGTGTQRKRYSSNTTANSTTSYRSNNTGRGGGSIGSYGGAQNRDQNQMRPTKLRYTKYNGTPEDFPALK